jgi:hypothetical protein
MFRPAAEILDELINITTVFHLQIDVVYVSVIIDMLKFIDRAKVNPKLKSIGGWQF